MPCYKPLRGYRSRKSNPSGKRSIVFKVQEGFLDQPIEVPCGRCIGCRLERSRQWAIRCLHEAKLHENNCFITLTYAPEHIPPGGTLVLKHFQDFMKRLREKKGPGVRFFHCGEYGDRTSRPHYHAALFNCAFPDREVFKERGAESYYISEELSALWPFGHHILGELTFESAAYVARYVMKKITNKEDYTDANGKFWPSAETHYQGKKPEYTTMSRRPGIGMAWAKKYLHDSFKDDSVIIRGMPMKPPKAYGKIYSDVDPRDFRRVKNIRKKRAKARVAKNPDQRLEVREKVQLLRAKQLKRGYEDAS